MSSELYYPWRFSIAPMMDYTDRHFRYFLRLITRSALLYTEMITAQAIIHGDQPRLLGFDPSEHPIALQLGGSDPASLAKSAMIAKGFGYDEINLNVGCPSDRVQEGRFGACLMKEPKLVAECVAAMKDAVDLPVTVKTRLGVDELDSDEYLEHFVDTVQAAGCKVFIIHARKAWLKGLSPKENRSIPPLNYDRVYRLKKTFPHLKIILNGGLQTIEQIQTGLEQLDGVMIGRQAYRDPYSLHLLDSLSGIAEKPLTRLEVLTQFQPYIVKSMQQGLRLTSITRHLHGLFHNTPKAKIWRRYLSDNAHKAHNVEQAQMVFAEGIRLTDE